MNKRNLEIIIDDGFAILGIEPSDELTVKLEKLLTKGCAEGVIWLSELFWSRYGEKKVLRQGNPLKDNAELVDLSSKCYDLYYHYPFQLDGVDVLEFIDKTPCRNLAAYMTRTMLVELSRKLEGVNDVCFNYLTFNDQIFSNYTYRRESPSEYINSTLVMIERVENHLKAGAELGLSDEELAVNDALTNSISHYFLPKYVNSAKEIVAYVTRDMQVRPRSKEAFRGLFYAKLDKIVAAHRVKLEPGSLNDMRITDYCNRKYDEMYGNED